MFDLMQYALIFYDFQLILAQMGAEGVGTGPMGNRLHKCSRRCAV